MKNAFVYDDLCEEIYMSMLRGYKILGKIDLVCKLKKALYGLKYSLRVWLGRFSLALKNYG